MLSGEEKAPVSLCSLPLSRCLSRCVSTSKAFLLRNQHFISATTWKMCELLHWKWEKLLVPWCKYQNTDWWRVQHCCFACFLKTLQQWFVHICKYSYNKPKPSGQPGPVLLLQFTFLFLPLVPADVFCHYHLRFCVVNNIFLFVICVSDINISAHSKKKSFVVLCQGELFTLHNKLCAD